MRLLFILAQLLAVLVASAAGQAARSASEAPPIQDNSFLVEEAYNQERGVVQHINTFQRRAPGGAGDAPERGGDVHAPCARLSW